MSFPVAPGMSNQSGTFVPEWWSATLLYKYYQSTVVAQICNTAYEGELRQHGDRIHIRTVPDITVRDYVVGQALVSERPDSPKVTLVVDRGKYFSVEVDDVIAVQSDLALADRWAEDAAEQIKIAVDVDVLNAIAADAAAANRGTAAGRRSGALDLGATGAPVPLTAETITDSIVDLGSVLDEQDVPSDDRWIVLPSWAAALIKKSELKDASLAGDPRSMLRTGEIGMIDRFRIFQSNLIAPVTDGSDTCWNILAGQRQAVSFVTQFVNVERLRAEATFADILRGLQIYGFRTLKPDGLAVLYATRGD